MVRVRVRVIFCVVFFCVVFWRCIVLYCIYSLDSDLTLTMQNIDVTQETTAQLRAEKINLGQNYSKQRKREKYYFAHNVIETDKTESKGAKSVGYW